MDQYSSLPVTLLDLLRNSFFLYEVLPYLPIASAIALTSTSRSVRELLYNAPELFRYLDLSEVKSAILPPETIDGGGISWRKERMDEALTPEEFYSGPLRGIFSKLARKNVLGNIHTLVLDGLSVPADLVQDIISNDRFNVRVLSIREVGHLNEGKLMQALNYAVRPFRPEGMPRLCALYIFGSRDTPLPVPSKTKSSWSQSRRMERAVDAGVMSSEGAQIGSQSNERPEQALLPSSKVSEYRWYQKSGRMFKRTPRPEWADTIRACEGIIAFDAVLCRGPRHDLAVISQDDNQDPSRQWLKPTIATIALGPSGCEICGTAVEGPAKFDTSPSHHLPLLAPPARHSCSVQAAQRPDLPNQSMPPLFVRCEDCLRGRWCERCSKWWDEQCYSLPMGIGNNRQSEVSENTVIAVVPDKIRVHMGLCTEFCLVSEMMSGAGSFGMWG